MFSKHEIYKFLIVIIVIAVLSVLYLILAPMQSPDRAIASFEDCVAAGNPVMESYPRQCRTADGRLFVEEVEFPREGDTKSEQVPPELYPVDPYPGPSSPDDDDDNVACTLDAKLCPDGSYVGRVPPSCDFAPCPGEGQGINQNQGSRTPGAYDGCVITGCSSQVCSDEPMATTCEYRPEYACYDEAVCERQASGECGWRETNSLNVCLSNSM